MFSKNTLPFALAILLFALAVPTYSQTCMEANLIGSNETQVGVIVGQTFTMDDCSNGNFTQLILTPTQNVSYVRLTIHEGTGFTNPARYTHPITDFNVLEPVKTFTLSSANGNVSFVSGQVYTIKLQSFDDMDGNGTGGSISLLRGGNVYDDGMMYDANGLPVTTEDLVFVMETSSMPLPVELTHFDARSQNGQSLLTWQTASELDNAGFDVERSADGHNWKTLGFVAGAGTTNDAQDYFFADEKPMPGQNYYRLRQMDFSGEFDFSPVRVVSNNLSGNTIVVSPNPVSAGQTLTLAGLDEDASAAMLLDLYGRPVWESTTLDNPTLSIPLDSNLPKGIYSMLVFSNGGKTVKRVVVQ